MCIYIKIPKFIETTFYWVSSEFGGGGGGGWKITLKTSKTTAIP